MVFIFPIIDNVYLILLAEVMLFRFTTIGDYPITTSKTIISTNPTAKPMVLRLECSPEEASATCLSS